MANENRTKRTDEIGGFSASISTKRTTQMAKQHATICNCGCNNPTKGGMFCMGHDARLKALLNAVIREEKPKSAIPAIARANFQDMKFVQAKREYKALFNEPVKTLVPFKAEVGGKKIDGRSKEARAAKKAALAAAKAEAN